MKKLSWKPSDVKQVTALLYGILASQLDGFTASMMWAMAALYMINSLIKSFLEEENAS